MAANGTSTSPSVRAIASFGLALHLAVILAGAQTLEEWKMLERFMDAIALNDTNAAFQILESNTNLAQRGYNLNKLPLLQAAAAGNLPLVKRLVELGADINAAGDTLMSAGAQATALHVAIRHNRPAVCRWLLEAGADPNRMAFGFNTPLHEAFAENREEMAGWLLDFGADPFKERLYVNDRTTPFELAITRGSGKLVPRMLGQSRGVAGAPGRGAELRPEAGPQPRNNQAAQFLAARGTAMLEAAVQRGQLEAAEALLAAGVSPKVPMPQRYSLLQTLALATAAARHRNDFDPERWAKLCDLLRRHGCEYDAFVATGLGDLETARTLWTANGNVVLARDAESQTLLHRSVQTDRLPLTDFWLKVGVSPAATNRAGQTPLHLAAARGLPEQVARLLEARAPTDVRDTNGWTPLEAAVQAKQPATIRLLLATGKAGAAGVPAARGIATPLHRAAASGDIAALAALVEGGNLEARNELGFTPLHLAMQHGHLAAAALLLDKGADVNARDPDGNTTLHLILLHRPAVIQSRPPASWLARRRSDPGKAVFVRYLTTKDEESMEWPVPNAAALLLAAGADAAAKNKAGKTIVQIAMDESTMLFDEERAALLKLLGATGRKPLEARDANGDTALHRAARGLDETVVADLIAAGADVNATNRLGRTPLHAALEANCLWEVPFLEILKAKPDVNARDNEGLTPLHVVASSRVGFTAKGTRALLDAGADPNARDTRGRTPAHLFLEGGAPVPDIVWGLDTIVKAGADLSLADERGRTPLHYLASRGADQGFLFWAGIGNVFGRAPNVDLAARDHQGDTPLHLAARTKTWSVFWWLVEQGANLDATNPAGETPRGLAACSLEHPGAPANRSEIDIFSAISADQMDTVSKLLETAPALLTRVNWAGQTPLRFAVSTGRAKMVELLEAKGAQWDAVSAALAGRSEVLRQLLLREPDTLTNRLGGRSLLHLGAVQGHPDIVRLLLAAGSDWRLPDSAGLSALGLARLSNRVEVANLLVSRGATLNLFDAVWLHDFERFTALTRAGKSFVNVTNPAGFSLAEVAVAHGEERMLARLLGLGVRADFAGARQDKSLLHLAALANQTNCAALLLQRGARPDPFDKNGLAPLHCAALQGHPEMVAVLLRHGADVNVRTRKPPPRYPDAAGIAPGSTPLHLAAMSSHTNVVELLLAAGADVNARDGWGRTPLATAQSVLWRMEWPGMYYLFVLKPLELGLGLAPRVRTPFPETIQRNSATLALLEKAGARR